MTLRNLFIFNVVIALVYGISLVVVPATVLSLHGMTQGPSERLAGQFFGVALISLGLLTGFARNAEDSEARRAIVLAQFISSAIGVIVTVLGTLSGAMNALGWLGVVLYLLLTLGYGYFQFIKPSAS
jgi:hypothetical protein